MRDFGFASEFANELQQYVEDRVATGFKAESSLYILRKFDRFCIAQNIQEPVFTAEHASAWIMKQGHEASTTHYARVNKVKQFLIYLARKGYPVFMTRDIRFVPTDFQPHIYSDDELFRYFRAVDSFSTRSYRTASIQFPVLFRLLYCCGTRIDETLGIRRRDVDIENGVIKLCETKNATERYIVLNEELTDLLRRYAEKRFYLFLEDDYIFTSIYGERMNGDRAYDYHRMILENAGIPYIGGGYGPRLHDLRHTFSVKSFKQMIDSGLDMYVALPLLSTYLGHRTILATERYVRLTMRIYPYIEEQFNAKLEMIFQEVAQT